jgi:hypothetical protein
MTDISGTHFTGTTTEYPYVYWPFSAISVFCFCFGVPSNLFSLAYFLRKNRSRPTYVCLLYIFMNTVDLMICFLCLPIAMTNLSDGKELFYSFSFLCSVWGYLWQILIRLSVFSVGLMSVCRTISLSLPFVRLSKRHLLIPASVYSVLLFVEQSMPWWYNEGYELIPLIKVCSWIIWFDQKSLENKVMFIVFILLPFILPLFPIIISCLISVVKLKTDTTNCDSGMTKVGNEHAARAKKNKRSATITIIILTLAYILFNVPYCIIMVDMVVYSLSEGKANITDSWFSYDLTPYYYEIYFFVTFYSIPLNSTINPMIYILRIKNLRCYIWDVVNCKAEKPSRAQIFSMPTIVTKAASKQRISNSTNSRIRLC